MNSFKSANRHPVNLLKIAFALQIFEFAANLVVQLVGPVVYTFRFNLHGIQIVQVVTPELRVDPKVHT